MTGSRMKPAILVGLFLGILAISLQGVQGEEEELEPVPSEDLCRPYIEKALKDLGTGSLEQTSAEVEAGASEDEPRKEESNEQGDESTSKEGGEEGSQEENQDSGDGETAEVTTEEEAQGPNEESAGKKENDSAEDAEGKKANDDSSETASNEAEQKDAPGGDDKSGEKEEEYVESNVKEEYVESNVEEDSKEGAEDSKEGAEDSKEEAEDSKEDAEKDSKEDAEKDSKEGSETDVDSGEKDKEEESGEKKEDDDADSKADDQDDSKNDPDSKEGDAKGEEDTQEDKSAASVEDKTDSEEKGKDGKSEEDDGKSEAEGESKEEESADSIKEVKDSKESKAEESSKEKEEATSRDRREAGDEDDSEGGKFDEEAKDDDDGDESEETESMPEEELIQEIEVPEHLRPRDHINQLLKLDEDNEVKEKAIGKAAEIILRDLKKLYDNAIKPLETLYKYRDLSNRHFGDSEIFSKPLVLFMGPWSGGKSSIINYLLDNEYKSTSLRTGAEPSPAYFNILMHGEEEEVLDGTQLAADWTFSGLQKFGQGMLDRLRGLRLNNKLLEKINIVEIPGILEIRKQVQRLFPFNDACQWFIDRADIIFLVYDPSKLDVGPETEAILDQLKGREYQTRIILNKADQVKPEELMRVQGALIWNISPLMSSAEPPIMYSTSLWSIPYEDGAPTRLLYAQERAFLRDLRSAIDKRAEHKIASARRFAVRVRNHAKMVDCYLTTYYNHKSFFGNKKETSDKIIENPQDYHIYEGLSTLTNISRYDLPDPDVYRDFFRLNPLYEFPLLSTTCTYFRGCPINRLDVAIAYDLPELVGKYRKSVEAALHESEPSSPPS